MHILRLKDKVPILLQIQLYWLYRRSFPRRERKPFRVILSMWRKGKTDIWIIAEQKKPNGFAATINGEEAILLDYLAIVPGLRGAGYGSRMIETLKRYYHGKGLFVEIESVFEESPEKAERMLRKHFYEINGMREMRVLASVFGVPMELMGWNCQIDFWGYRQFYHDQYSAFAAEHICELPYPNHKPRSGK